MRVDLEPALLLSEDGAASTPCCARTSRAPQPSCATATPTATSTSSTGSTTRRASPSTSEALDVPSAIADGHHRYKVGQRFAEEHGAGPAPPPRPSSP